MLDRPSEVHASLSEANEPRDTLVYRGVRVAADGAGAPGRGYGWHDLYTLGALYRSVQMFGALLRVRDLTVQYAQERVQFGRPIGKFQAIQQQIAVLAANTAAAGAACDAAVERSGDGISVFEVAAAKARVGEAAGLVAATAHQVHGAMGFTHEYPLHRLTRRLWSWRDEFGTEAFWQGWIGRNVMALGGHGLWPFLTDPLRRAPVPLADYAAAGGENE